MADDGPRMIVGRTILGVRRLIDMPAQRGAGRRYVIECGPFADYAAVTALVADYLGQVERWGCISGGDRWLAENPEERDA